MRILLSSNAPWCRTGYGVQAASLLPRLSNLDMVGGPENVALFAWFGVQGGLTQWGPHLVYPGHGHPYGTDVIGHHAQHFGADVVITLIDVWTQEGVGEKVKPARWLPWFPVDTEPVSPRVLEALEGAALPLVYSRFGERTLKEAGIDCAYVPHGIEPSVFRIIEERDAVMHTRTALAGPDCEHLTVMVAANKGFPDRKAFAANLRAWKLFAADRPAARLYIHTDPTPQAGGADLLELVHSLGVVGKVRFPDRYSYYLGYPAEYMALIYNAADVLLAASMCEGFGIPLIEAQACGCPVVTTDHSSMTELVHIGKATQPLDSAWSVYGTWWALPSIEAIADALEELHSMRLHSSGQRAKQAQGASAEVSIRYSWDMVVRQYWQPVLKEVSR